MTWVRFRRWLYFPNLAVIAKLLGEAEQSAALAGEAARLGFADGDFDAILNGVGQTYARLATRR